MKNSLSERYQQELSCNECYTAVTNTQVWVKFIWDTEKALQLLLLSGQS